jgi:Ser/Thr protein kinase RdoA (MazF antagonist)
MTPILPVKVLNAYSYLGEPLSIAPVVIGLINKTYLVTTHTSPFILQEVSPIFSTGVTKDSFHVSLHLEKHGILSPKPYLTDGGELFLTDEGRVFRALAFIPGYSFSALNSPKMAESAGRVVGQFHRAMMDFVYDYASKRRHGGDYAFHEDNLVTTLKSHFEHEYFSRAQPLALAMLAASEQLTRGLVVTKRHAHGDPKVSNILFDKDEQAICLVDFDTLGETGWSVEMADALRSWCNPYAEDVMEAYVDLERVEYALKGYGSLMRGVITEKEVSELPVHAQAITLCLAMRYLADVFNETYFRYDDERFSRPAEHNWQRAQSMFGLFMDFSQKAKKISDLAMSFLL